MRHQDHDEQPYIVIEKHSGGVGNLLLGVLIGAGVALLFAPRSGEETRSDISRRAYAKRVWDNAGEDNVLFLAGGIAFNILLAAVPFVLLLVWGLANLLNRSSAEANEVVVRYIDKLLPSHVESPDAVTHKLISQ